MEILKYASSNNLYSIVTKMLDDYDNGLKDLPESIEMIDKVRSICNTISTTKKNSITGSQSNVLLRFVSNNLGVYGDDSNEEEVKRLFKSLLKA